MSLGTAKPVVDPNSRGFHRWLERVAQEIQMPWKDFTPGTFTWNGGGSVANVDVDLARFQYFPLTKRVDLRMTVNADVSGVGAITSVQVALPIPAKVVGVATDNLIGMFKASNSMGFVTLVDKDTLIAGLNALAAFPAGTGLSHSFLLSYQAN